MLHNQVRGGPHQKSRSGLLAPSYRFWDSLVCMSVFKRGNVWWYKFFWNGERIRASTKSLNKRVAQQIEAARKAALAKGEVGIKELAPAPTFRKFSQRFLSWVERERKPNTIKYYNDMVRILLRYQPLAGAKLTQIDRDLIARYIEKRRDARKTGVRRGKEGVQHTIIDRTITVTALNHEVGTIRRMLNIAADWGVIEYVPKIRLKGTAKQVERILSPAEEDEYIENAPQPLRDLAVVCLDTSLRPGEAVGLRWENVFLRSRRESVGRVQILNGKSKNAKRTVMLLERVAEVLRLRHREAGSPAEGWVFPGSEEDGSLNYSSLDSQHDRLIKKLGFAGPLRLYDLRHTALTRLAQSGADVFSIQKIAGHSDIRVTSRYVHPTPEHIKQAFSRLQEYNNRSNKAQETRKGPGRESSKGSGKKESA
jgi:integrase